jgi:broad specificity phosphatase PhoE
MIHPDTEVHLYLIRHAESDMNVKPGLVGGQSPDAEITSRGEEQASGLNKWLRDHKIKFDHVYCSPFRRTKQTALIGINGGRIELDSRLIEYSAGDWEGERRSSVQTPEVKHQMAEMTVDFQPPIGESQRQVSLRVANWLQDAILSNQKLLQYGAAQSIAAFSHGLTIKCLLHHILGFDSHYIWRMELDNCSVSKLVFNARGWWPKYINRVPY